MEQGIERQSLTRRLEGAKERKRENQRQAFFRGAKGNTQKHTNPKRERGNENKRPFAERKTTLQQKNKNEESILLIKR